MRIAAVLLLFCHSTLPFKRSRRLSHPSGYRFGSPRWVIQDAATTGLFIGTADVYPESVVVTFDSTHIRLISHEAGRSTYHLDSMTVGLATTSGNSWDSSAESVALTIPDSLAEHVTFSLGKLRFNIPRAPEQPIKGRWLLVTFYQIVAPALVPREQQATGTTYAHSARGIFSKVTVPSYTTSAPLTPAQVPVQITSLQTNFMTKGLLIGTAVVYPESVVVAFDSTYIKQHEYEGRSSAHLDSMTVSLATGSSGKWQLYAKSAALTIADSLAERVTFSLGKARFNISRPPGESLRNSWLVVTFHQINSFVPREQQGGSTTYAHSAAIFSRLNGR